MDKSIVKFKGRISFITYNPQKPTKWGICIYVLADANIGYIQTTLPHYGSFMTNKLVRPDLSISTRIVLQLYQNLLQSNPELRPQRVSMCIHARNMHVCN